MVDVKITKGYNQEMVEFLLKENGVYNIYLTNMVYMPTGAIVIPDGATGYIQSVKYPNRFGFIKRGLFWEDGKWIRHSDKRDEYNVIWKREGGTYIQLTEDVSCKNTTPPKKKHYFLVNFTLSGNQGCGNFIQIQKERYINSVSLKQMNEHIKQLIQQEFYMHSPQPTGLITNISYLGEMTDEEFGDVNAWQQ